jgi:16S rRNA processing protein RimM
LADILKTGSNDVYVVRKGPKDLLIPALPDVILEVDVAKGRMIVELLPGLES